MQNVTYSELKVIKIKYEESIFLYMWLWILHKFEGAVIFIGEHISKTTIIMMNVRLRRTWILTCTIYLVLLFDTAELQDITFPKSKDGKGKIDKGMLQNECVLFLDH